MLINYSYFKIKDSGAGTQLPSTSHLVYAYADATGVLKRGRRRGKLLPFAHEQEVFRIQIQSDLIGLEFTIKGKGGVIRVCGMTEFEENSSRNT